MFNWSAKAREGPTWAVDPVDFPDHGEDGFHVNTLLFLFFLWHTLIGRVV